jgi:hypothetical protein
MEPLSAAEERCFDRLCREHDAIHDDDRDAPALLVREADASPAGSVFDAVDYTDENKKQHDWGIGARRGIAKVIRYFPDANSRQGLMVYRWLKKYRVTPETIRIAKACGVFEKKQPTGERLWNFERRLRAENIRGWD